MHALRTGMKAGLALRQLEDRMQKCRALGIPVLIELHTSEPEDVMNPARLAQIEELLRPVRAEHGSEVTLHTPPVTMRDVESVPFERPVALATLRAARKLGATHVVLHRSYGYVQEGRKTLLERTEAVERFQAEVVLLAREAEGVRLQIENTGFFHRGYGTGRYLVSPLDHFFPWERREFVRFLARENLTSVATMLDIAHACQSANMFNLLRRHYTAFRHDARFGNIEEADLEQAEFLTPYDFMENTLEYVHLSDAHTLEYVHLSDAHFPGPEWPGVPAAEAVEEALTTENLRIGKGNLDFGRIVSVLQEGVVGAPLSIAEVNPAKGETQFDQQGQFHSVRRLLELARERERRPKVSTG